MRAPYLDEFWTMVFANPDIPLTDAWDMWSGDRGHPVLYVASMRVASELVGQGVLIGRLVNFVPLALFLTIGGLAYRVEGSRKFALFFTILTLSLYFVVERFADQRSYFLAMMMLGSVILLIRMSFEDGRPRIHVPIVLLSVLLGLIHYSIALAGFAVLTSAAISHLSAGRRSQTIWSAGAAFALASAIALSYINGLGYEEIPSPYHISMTTFALMLGVTMAIAAMANPFLSWLALRAIISDHDIHASVLSGPRDWLSRFWGFAALALLFAMIGYTALNYLLHILLARQLMAVSVIAVALVAALVADSDFKAAQWPIAFASFASLAISTALVARQENFFVAVPFLQQQQSECDTYRIFARHPDEIIDFPAKENARQRHLAIDLGYAHVAATTGLRLQRDQSQMKFDPTCGSAVWIQQFNPVPGTDPVTLLETLRLDFPEQYAGRAQLITFKGAAVIHIPGEPQNKTQ